MEMLIIAVVAIVAFAAVLIPLFRRRPDEHEAAEFEAGGEPRAARPREEGDVVPPMAAGPVSPFAPAMGAEEEAGVHTSDAAPAESAAEDEVEIEVQRYRAALRAGTLCSKCGQANPAESKFCFDCGAALPLAEAREFD
jgi:cell division septation protein DedD